MSKNFELILNSMALQNKALVLSGQALIKHTGILVYYINPFDDVAEAKHIIRERGISSGVINDIPLMDWDKATIYNEVKTIMQAGAEGGRFIFGTLVMPYLIPDENIHHLFNAAREYGAYA